MFSWLSPNNITDFNEDISPLLQYLYKNDLVPASLYLGAVQFGSETFHATSNVTFSVNDFSINMTSTGSPDGDILTPLASGQPQPNGLPDKSGSAGSLQLPSMISLLMFMMALGGALRFV